MQVDGFTLLAQVVNFLILVYLLKRFLYRPIINAMDRREAGIAARMNQAEQLQQAAQAERERYQQEQQKLTEQRQQWLDEARSEADAERQAQLAEARREIERSRQQWLGELRREQEQFLNDVRRQLGTELCTLTQQALSEMADVELQDRLIAVFLRRLRALPESQRAELRHTDLRIISAQPLDSARRTQLQTELANILGDAQIKRFEQQPELVCGIALRTPQGELSWDLSDYLAGLNDRLRERVDNYAMGNPGKGNPEEAEDESADSAAGEPTGS